MVLANLIGGFIVVLVGVSLMPVIGDQVYNARFSTDNPANGVNATNVTGAAATLLELSSLFFAIGIMSAGVALAVGGLKQAGLM